MYDAYDKHSRFKLFAAFQINDFLWIVSEQNNLPKISKQKDPCFHFKPLFTRFVGSLLLAHRDS